MGWYIRKGIKLGPLRLNLSKSGIGASFGVKGARIGSGPRGAYVHGGRGGIYYRKQLNGSNGQTAGTSQQQENVHQQSEEIREDNLQKIESADVSKMRSESSQDFLDELNAVIRYRNKATIFLVLSILVTAFMAYKELPTYVLMGSGIIALTVWIVLLKRDMRLNKFQLTYDLDDSLNERLAGVLEKFKDIRSSKKIWSIDASGDVEDKKRSGGASTSFDRKLVKPSFSSPNRVTCNLKVPVFPAGEEKLYFFPDRILVFQKGKVGAVKYDELKVEFSDSRFMEEERVPSDAEKVGSTWQYVNKKGDPDKRFKDNREIPIMLYGKIYLKSDSGLNELFMFSSINACRSLSDLCNLFVSH